MISLIGMKLCMHTHTKKLKVQALMYLVFNNNKKKTSEIDLLPLPQKVSNLFMPVIIF